MQLLNRPEGMIRITTPELAKEFIDEQTALIQEQVGDKKFFSHSRAVWIRPWSPRF